MTIIFDMASGSTIESNESDTSGRSYMPPAAPASPVAEGHIALTALQEIPACEISTASHNKQPDFAVLQELLKITDN